MLKQVWSAVSCVRREDCDSVCSFEKGVPSYEFRLGSSAVPGPLPLGRSPTPFPRVQWAWPVPEGFPMSEVPIALVKRWRSLSFPSGNSASGHLVWEIEAALKIQMPSNRSQTST